jgi:hypothetical protein
VGTSMLLAQPAKEQPDAPNFRHPQFGMISHSSVDRPRKLKASAFRAGFGNRVPVAPNILIHRSATSLPFAKLRFFETILQQVALHSVKKFAGSEELAAGLFF